MNKDYIERELLIDQFSGGDEVKSLAESIHDSRFVEALKKAPAADVERVRHAHWREETEYYDDEYSEFNTRQIWVCSLCDRTEKNPEPYCNCGAKMDEVN